MLCILSNLMVSQSPDATGNETRSRLSFAVIQSLRSSAFFPGEKVSTSSGVVPNTTLTLKACRFLTYVPKSNDFDVNVNIDFNDRAVDSIDGNY
ncbi:predicted protein [Botrytis cinerea T4]|uniref:Uncharacterized protein n=1 Tax=Botryotinia fuckeliana (strain T4) TaxID=999810 RepID=G2XY13_BOTF4|nr:predicted protein [Botrytis cinerea T4]